MTATRPICDGIVGKVPGDFGFVPVGCGQSVGIRVYATAHSFFGTAAYCPRHETDVRRRFPEYEFEPSEPRWLHEDPEFAPDPIDLYKVHLDRILNAELVR